MASTPDLILSDHLLSPAGAYDALLLSHLVQQSSHFEFTSPCLSYSLGKREVTSLPVYETQWHFVVWIEFENCCLLTGFSQRTCCLSCFQLFEFVANPWQTGRLHLKIWMSASLQKKWSLIKVSSKSDSIRLGWNLPTVNTCLQPLSCFGQGTR